MSNFTQTTSVFQGNSEVLTFTVTVSGLTTADVGAVSFTMRRRGTTALTLTKAGGGIIVRTDATHVYLDVYLTGAATAALSGVYAFELYGAIDSVSKHRAAGYITVKEAALS